MAASECNRDMVYFTFGDTGLMSELKGVHDYLFGRGATVGDLYKIVASYHSDMAKNSSGAQSDLYEYVRLSLSFDQETDDEDEISDKGDGAPPRVMEQMEPVMDQTEEVQETSVKRQAGTSSPTNSDSKQTKLTDYYKPK